MLTDMRTPLTVTQMCIRDRVICLLRLLGMLLLVLTGAFAGFQASLSLAKRERELELFFRFVQSAETEILFSALPDVYKRQCMSCLFPVRMFRVTGRADRETEINSHHRIALGGKNDRRGSALSLL